MICVSIGEKTIEDTLKTIKLFEFVEVRLDKIKDLNIENFMKIIDTKKKLLITFRKGQIENNERLGYFKLAIENGVEYIDLDMDTDKEIIDDLISNKMDTKFILSYHNFKKTPKQEQLREIIENGRLLGGDLIKIATTIKHKKDNLLLLNLLEYENIIIAGMGKLGKITRLASIFLGAPFTYSSASHDKKTANGQIEFKRMLQMVGELS